MTNIHLTQPVFYAGGVGGVSSVVGYESLRNRVARYELTAPSTGASALTLAFSGNTMGNGTPPELAFYIGTDPDSHADAGMGSTYTGLLRRSADGVTYTGAASLMLLPGEKRYLWVFPTTTAFGWMAWSREAGCAVVTCSGGALTTCRDVSGYVGSELTLHLTRYGDFTHTITLDGQVICENAHEDQVSWPVPLDLMYAIPGAAGEFELRITTLSGGEALGSTTARVTLLVPETVVPTVSATWEDEAARIPGVLLQNMCMLKVTPVATPAPGSAIVQTVITLDGKAYQGERIPESGDRLLSVTVTDSRGRSAVWEETLCVTPYALPESQLTAYRCDEDRTPNEMGEYVLATLTGYLWPLEKTVATPWASIVVEGEAAERVAVSDGQVRYEKLLPLSSLRAFRLEGLLCDGAAIFGQSKAVVPIGYATLDLLAGGKGIAFGTTAREEGFVCAMDARFTGGMTIGGSDLADFVVEQGGSGVWYYRKWQSGFCELFAQLDMKFVNSYSMGATAPYPFALTRLYSALATNNYAAAGGSNWCADWNTKVEADTEVCKVFVQSKTTTFSSLNGFSASAAITGRWK